MGSDTMKDEQYYVDIISAMAEHIIRRLCIVIILLIVLLVGTNIAWIYYENQFEEVVTTIEAQTDDGGAAIANADGSVTYYGESNSDN